MHAALLFGLLFSLFTFQDESNVLPAMYWRINRFLIRRWLPSTGRTQTVHKLLLSEGTYSWQIDRTQYINWPLLLFILIKERMVTWATHMEAKSWVCFSPGQAAAGWHKTMSWKTMSFREFNWEINWVRIIIFYWYHLMKKCTFSKKYGKMPHSALYWVQTAV